MSVISELYVTKLELYQKEQELSELREEYDNYRKIVESRCNNKKVKDIKEHVSWMDRKELMKKAKEVTEEEWLENRITRARREEGIKKRREAEEEKKRAAERKALDELMEKERRERNRKNKDAN